MTSINPSPLESRRQRGDLIDEFSKARSEGIGAPWHNQGCSRSPGPTLKRASRTRDKTDLCADNARALYHSFMHRGSAVRWWRTLQEQHVRSIRNKLKDRPSAADHTVDKIGMLWSFAKEYLEMKLGPNPAIEVAAIHTKRESYRAWPPDLCGAFQALPRPRLRYATPLRSKKCAGTILTDR